MEKEGGRSLFKDYLHLNEHGNDLVAREVTKFLTTGYFLDEKEFSRQTKAVTVKDKEKKLP